MCLKTKTYFWYFGMNNIVVTIIFHATQLRNDSLFFHDVVDRKKGDIFTHILIELMI